jgi:hypothetical protein
MKSVEVRKDGVVVVTGPAPEEQVSERNGKNPERKSLNVQTFSDAL